MIPPTIKIPLTRGLFAVVDEADGPALLQHKWSADNIGHTTYAVRCSNRKKIYMHRQVAGFPIDKEVDHWNRDGLRNTRRNLRISTIAQNRRNGGKKLPFGRATSRYKGVSWDASRQLWKAQIKKDYKGICIGRFQTEEEAAIAYNRKAKELFGEFAMENIL